MLQALFERETPLGPDRLRGGGEVRGGGGGERKGGGGGITTRKELAHAQYWESAIHSLSTGPLLSSLPSFPLMIVSEEVRQREIWIREMKLFCLSAGGKMMNRPDRIISERLGGRVIASVNQMC